MHYKMVSDPDPNTPLHKQLTVTDFLGAVSFLVPVDTHGYAYMQGGLSGALYRCEKEDADFVLIRVGDS